MSTRPDKLRRLGLLVGATVLLLILAASLSTLTFRVDWLDAVQNTAGSGGEGAWNWLKGFIIAGVIALVVLFLLSVLLAPTKRRPLPRRSSILGLLLFFIALALIRPEMLRTLMALQATPAPVEPGAPAPSPALPSAPSNPLPYVAASLVVAVGLVLLAWWGWRSTHRAPQAAQEVSPVPGQVVETAQAALQALQDGASLSNVILRCYRDMSQLVAERHAVVREAGVTPREFVARMVQAGVPRRPVEQLTTLFELVRYGAKPLGASEEAQATACLQSLADAMWMRREGAP